MGMARGGSSKGGGDRLSHFVNQQRLNDFISSELKQVTAEPIIGPPEQILIQTDPLPGLVLASHWLELLLIGVGYDRRACGRLWWGFRGPLFRVMYVRGREAG